MSAINGKRAEYWIEENHPENGLFRVYWIATIDPEQAYCNRHTDCSGHLRYEWEYKDGKRDGISRGWYMDGSKKSLWRWKDGKRHGKWTDWFPDGKKRAEGEWREGKRIGFVFTWWDNSGHLRKEVDWDNGGYLKNYWSRESVHIIKDGNGRYEKWKENLLEVEGNYKNGEKDGLWRYYDDDGKVIRTEIFYGGLK